MTATVLGRPTVRSRRAAWAAHRRDALALATLVGIPLTLFGLPALAGYPLLTGDDVIQNYPLRVLAGQALAHGQLPVYNPFNSGGEALLGGLNAGAAFPDVILFGLLPPLAAWVIVEAIAYAGAACGLYLFLRANTLRPLPAWLGGASFGLAGFLASQAVHLDVVETGAGLAWALLAIERLAHDAPWRRAGWAALLGVAAGCTALAASPEAGFDAAAGAIAYALHLLARERQALRLGGWMAGGALAGALLGGIQIATGAATVDASQRSHVTYAFVTAGTLDRALVLLLAPHLLGGGPVGLRPYVGAYNLAEIDAYSGIPALMGAAYLVAARRRPGASRWRIWYVVGGLGLAIATGAHTGVARILVHLPVIGESRLPSRALLLYALATSVLLAYFVSELLDPCSVSPEPGIGRRAGLLGSRQTGRSLRRAGLAAAVAPLAVLVLLVVVVVGGRGVAVAIAGQAVGPWSLAAIAPYLGCTAALALLALALALSAHRLSRRQRQRLLVALAACDLLLFTVNQSSFAGVPSSALGVANPLAASLAERLHGGRFAVVDPGRSGGLALDRLGAADLNGLLGEASVQGYGSLVWAPYEAATATHGQDVIGAAALAGTVFDSLDLRLLLVVGSDFAGPDTVAARAITSWSFPRGASATRYFGATFEVRSLSLAATPGRVLPAGELRSLASGLRLLDDSGRELAARPVASITSRALTLVWRRPARAAGVTVELPPGRWSDVLAPVVELASGERVALDGPLAPDAVAPHWRLAGALGSYQVLLDTRAAEPLSLVPLRGAAPAGVRAGRARPGSVRVLASSRFSGQETVLVDSSAPVRLVRSVADLPGWQATLVAAGERRQLAIEREGVVQSVTLPRGREVVTFTYTPPGLVPGLAASAGGAAAVLGLVAVALLGMVRRRRLSSLPPGGRARTDDVSPVRSPAPVGT